MLKKIAFSLLLSACSSASDEPTVPTTETNLPAAPTAPASATGDWRARVKADLDWLRANNPQQLDELTKLAPSVTRAQFLRFTTNAIHDPRATSVFIDRLANGNESDGVRAALVDALPRSGGYYADAAVDLIATERSSTVRAAYLHAARRAPATEAIALMKRGLADASPEVQAEAIRTTASHAEGPRLATQLRVTLGSSDAKVRSESARTLGILKIAVARDELVAKLADASPDVRLESLRAIDRIAPGFAKTLPLAALAQDSDPRVASLVARITATTASPN